MSVKLVPRRMIPSTRIPCPKCGRQTRYARTEKWPNGITEVFDAEECLHSPDAAIQVQPNELLLYRPIRDQNSPPPRRPNEIGARLHSKTCPGRKGVDPVEFDTVVIPLQR